ncbi:MAG: c-type cytochrome [Pseudomonadales bacterium]|nr:c-type cytochrome [Pseudomonadales bacterium]
MKQEKQRKLGCLILFGLLSATAWSESKDHAYTSESVSLGYRVYIDNCALCHGIEGNWIEGVDLSRAQFKTAVTDHDIKGVILEGAAEGRMPRFDLSDDELDGIISYIRIGFDPDGVAVKIGDPVHGATIFRGNGECSSCHRVSGHGPRTAPDLSHVGSNRTPGALSRTLLTPEKALLPINKTVTLVTTAEETFTGRRLNEDTYTVQIIDSTERLRSFKKSDLSLYEISNEPTHKPSELSDEEVADVIAYLLTLRSTR